MWMDMGLPMILIEAVVVNVVLDVVNMPACDVLAFQVLLLLKATPRWNTVSGIQQYSSSGMQTSKCYHGHDQMIVD